eukprot:3937364-Rhodomonas_salina.2
MSGTGIAGSMAWLMSYAHASRCPVLTLLLLLLGGAAMSSKLLRVGDRYLSRFVVQMLVIQGVWRPGQPSNASLIRQPNHSKLFDQDCGGGWHVLQRPFLPTFGRSPSRPSRCSCDHPPTHTSGFVKAHLRICQTSSVAFTMVDPTKVVLSLHNALSLSRLAVQARRVATAPTFCSSLCVAASSSSR